MADVLVTVLSLEWETRVELLGLPDPADRVERAREALLAYMARRGIKPPSAAAPASSEGGMVVFRRPLTAGAGPGPGASAPPRPLGQAQGAPGPPIPEDLQPLFASFTSRQNASDLTPSAAQALQRELTRLSKIPPQSAEYSVGRTYVEWLLALPWRRATEAQQGLDLEKCRQVLEREHEGLEEVKRRVVEYLAVYQSVYSLYSSRR